MRSLSPFPPFLTFLLAFFCLALTFSKESSEALGSSPSTGESASHCEGRSSRLAECTRPAGQDRKPLPVPVQAPQAVDFVLDSEQAGPGEQRAEPVLAGRSQRSTVAMDSGDTASTAGEAFALLPTLGVARARRFQQLATEQEDPPAQSGPGQEGQTDEKTDLDRVEEEIVVRGDHIPTQVTVAKGVMDISEIPQTVNVISLQRIEDQNLTALRDVMEQTTGATVVPADGAGMNTYYFSRGYFIDTILLDGLPEADTIGSGYSTAFDTGIYERVEVLKGPSGLYVGAGEPGALLSLVRKRARPQGAVNGTFVGGSWNQYRAQVDITGSLNDSGRIRGRMVAVYDEGDSFRDVVEHERAQVYGILEFDLTSRTTLSTSTTHQDIDSVMDYGLPALADGTLLDVSRSTFIGTDWNQLDPRMSDFFVGLEHEFSDGGSLRLAGRLFDRTIFGSGAFSRSAVDPITGDVSLQTLGFDSERDGAAFDAYYSKPFQFAGLDHNLVLGADYRRSEDESVFRIGAPLTQNVFDPDNALPEQSLDFEFPLSPSETDQSGIYSQARIGLPGSLDLVLGGRVSWWNTENFDANTGVVSSENEIDGEFTPYAAVIWNGMAGHTLYASYAEIFSPQDSLTIDNERLPPRTGGQYEIGLKGEYLGGSLISHFAVFRIEDNNRAVPDPSSPPGLGAALPAGEVVSDGFEIELRGRLLPRLTLTAGYAYTDTEYEEAPVDQQGEPFSTFTPRHNFNLWASYQLSAPVDIGFGLRSVSSFYSQRGTVRFEADGYTTVQARVGYAFNERLNLSLIGNNLLDERYYEKVEAATRQNYFGAPRSLSLVLRVGL